MQSTASKGGMTCERLRKKYRSLPQGSEQQWLVLTGTGDLARADRHGYQQKTLLQAESMSSGRLTNLGRSLKQVRLDGVSLAVHRRVAPGTTIAQNTAASHRLGDLR